VCANQQHANGIVNGRLAICASIIYAVHDYFKHARGRDIFLLDWRQVLSYEVSFLNIRIVVNLVINLVNKNLPRTAIQILWRTQYSDTQ
jgi:hypothetical protein